MRNRHTSRTWLRKSGRYRSGSGLPGRRSLVLTAPNRRTLCVQLQRTGVTTLVRIRTAKLVSAFLVVAVDEGQPRVNPHRDREPGTQNRKHSIRLPIEVRLSRGGAGGP